jgi:hypothetical protein
MMASRPGDGVEASSSDLAPEDERAIVHRSLDRHYAEMIHEPIPMLGNITPLKAAKTEKGRQNLVAWLKLMENRSAKQPAGDPMAEYDFAWLWGKLGISGLRR